MSEANTSPTTQRESGVLFRTLKFFGLSVLVLVLVVLLLVVAFVFGGRQYLASNKLKQIEQTQWLNGGSISFRSFKGLRYEDYPHLTLSVENLEVTAASLAPEVRRLLSLGRAEVDLTLDVWSDTIAIIEQVRLDSGSFDLFTESDGSSNLSSLLGLPKRNAVEDQEQSGWQPQVLLNDSFSIVGEAMHFSYLKPSKGHQVATRLNSFYIANIDQHESFSADVDLDAFVEHLQFNTTEGSYIKNSNLNGKVHFFSDPSFTSVNAPALSVSGNRIGANLVLQKDKSKSSVLSFSAKDVEIDSIRPLLTPSIEKAIEDYQVEGTLNAQAVVALSPNKLGKAYVKVDLQVDKNTAKAVTEVFKNTYLRATFINRFPGVDSFATTLNNNEVAGISFLIDTVRSTYRGFEVHSQNTSITANPTVGPIINGHIVLDGPATAISNAVKSKDFMFSNGSVNIETDVSGSLNDLTKLIINSAGSIEFTDAEVHLPAVQTHLQLPVLYAEKVDSLAYFEITGNTGSDDHTYMLDGTLTNIEALLQSKSTKRVKSNVHFSSAHLSWEDLMQLLSPPPPTTEQPTSEIHTLQSNTATDQTTADIRTPAADAKEALRLIEATFDPSLNIEIDTFSYYGFSIDMFTTGAHFKNRDTLKLERTSFFIDTALVSLSGELDIAKDQKTPFNFDLSARHLNLQQILPALDYFGFSLLRDIGKLPNDVNADVIQEGQLDDSYGLLDNQSRGSITLVSNRTKPFEAYIDFEPDRPEDPEFHSTKVGLTGSPELFNSFFETEDFFFKRGHFDFDMGYNGLVPDIQSLLDHEEMHLDLRNTTVGFAQLGSSVPITRLILDMHRDTADVELFLNNADLGQEIDISGTATGVSQVVFGNTGKQFTSDVVLTSPRLVWSDLNALIGEFTSEEIDTAASAELNLRANLREVMQKFRPRARVDIDELQLAKKFMVQRVLGEIWMDQNDVLHLGKTGFDFLDGSMELSGSLDLHDLALTPFESELYANNLDIEGLLEGFEHFDIEAIKEARELSGLLSLDMVFSGAIAGDSAYLVPHMTYGKSAIEVEDLTVEGLMPVDNLAKSVNMRERLARLKFAPIRDTLVVDGNQLRVPFLELQSNAFNVFLEGEVGLTGPTDLWILVPMNNLNARDLASIPANRGLAVPRLRSHVVLQSEAGGKIKTSFRTSRKRFYKKRGIRDRRKQDRRSWRSARRAFSKTERKIKKAGL